VRCEREEGREEENLRRGRPQVEGGAAAPRSGQKTVGGRHTITDANGVRNRRRRGGEARAGAEVIALEAQLIRCETPE